MSYMMPIEDLETLLARFSQHLSQLEGYQVGLEREALRLDGRARLAQTHHPRTLGSALTNPAITVDFAESQLELISPTYRKIPDLIFHMEQLQAFVLKHLKGDTLWHNSMPPWIDDEDIQPAHFGSSHSGKIKEIYRWGLAHRYGKKMQTICGIHFNFSFLPEFWDISYQELQSPMKKSVFIAENYLGLLRNFQRNGWLLTYLFGATPAVDRSFFNARPGELDLWYGQTMYAPYATSLRMSQVGYVNDDRCTSIINYNSLTDYLAGIYHAIKTPCSQFEALGLINEGQYIQLNTNILQIENEHYALIRPKQPVRPGERPFRALRERGIEYVEVRGVDINPYEPTGIDAEQLEFIRLFLIYNLFCDNPPLTTEEEYEVKFNQNRVALEGRKPNLALQRLGQWVSIRYWTEDIFRGLFALARTLDQRGSYYTQLVEKQYQKIEDPHMTPSARVLRDIMENYGSFQEFGLAMSQKMTSHILQLKPDEDLQNQFAATVDTSLEVLAKLEAQDQNQDFESYLQEFNQLKTEGIYEEEVA